jgi:integrase
MAGQRWGQGTVYLRGTTWWIKFHKNGKAFYESSGSDSERDALRLLRERIGQAAADKFVPKEHRVMYADLKQGLVDDYKLNERRSLESLPYWMAHLNAYFGNDRAIDITGPRITAFINQRREAKAANASINRSTQALRRMFKLAVRARLISPSTVPYIPILDEPAREGFLEPGDFARLHDALPDYLKDFVEALYLTGWRTGELKSLEWRDVDTEGRTIRLRIENSKTKQARTIPLTGTLLGIISRAHDNRRPDCPHVFHDRGTPIGDFRKAWRNALECAELSGITPHDLRRSAVRNAIRAGVPQNTVMAQVGHKTSSMLMRYDIVSTDDLAAAAQRTEAYMAAHQSSNIIRLADHKKKTA